MIRSPNLVLSVKQIKRWCTLYTVVARLFVRRYRGLARLGADVGKTFYRELSLAPFPLACGIRYFPLVPFSTLC